MLLSEFFNTVNWFLFTGSHVLFTGLHFVRNLPGLDDDKSIAFKRSGVSVMSCYQLIGQFLDKIRVPTKYYTTHIPMQPQICIT